jgi:DNA invertase Pin-like site-specific DNA recombinase
VNPEDPDMPRCAVYLRVSDPQKQTLDNQRAECEALARGRGYELVEVYEEGASAAAVRPVFQHMMADARRRRFDVLIIWAIDRFGRSFVYNVLDVADLDRLGVLVVSVKESWLDTTSGMVRQILVGIFSAMAEHERERHKQRVRAGMDRARSEGKHLGRPRRSPVMLAAARDDVAKGASMRSAAQKRGVALSTLRDFLRRQSA